VATRGELSDLIWEMQGELGTSHAYEMGGDHRKPPSVALGYLGCFAAAVAGGSQPGYPPLFPILLWLGIRDPLFEGRLLPVVVAALFALFLRSRLARASPAGAPAATLFFVCTVHVWRGTAMY